MGTRKKRKVKTGLLRRSCLVFGHLLFWFLLCVGAYWAWLDKKVYDTFESASWALPAKVYGRSLELYSGAPVSSNRLVYELENLGYTEVKKAVGLGEYRRNGESEIVYYSRGYKYWDGTEESDLIQVDFKDSQIDKVISLISNRKVNLTRIEPIVIGSINPKSYEDRILLEYDELPKIFIESLIAVEDHRFFSHYGFDLFGLLRATILNLQAGAYVQGGSTLTQQLVKNFYLTRERSLKRKVTELLMAISLEIRFSKERILEVYTNEIFLGQDGSRAIHGFGLAAEFYFGKPLSELDVPAIACLVGLVKGPSALNPRSFPEESKKRRDFVLRVMEKRGLISGQRKEIFVNSPIEVKTFGFDRAAKPVGFLSLVKRQLREQYEDRAIRGAGLKIYTSLDLYVHNKAIKALKSTIVNLEKSGAEIEMLQAACVVIDPRTGEILTLLGGLEEIPGGFNRALEARRQVGSMIKPFVYALALSDPTRYSLITTLQDTEVEWGLEDGTAWKPKNFDGKERGDLSLLDSLIFSQNLATVNLGADLGIHEVVQYLKKVGFEGIKEAYPSILLGAVEATPLRLTQLYTIFANDGFLVPLRSILEVTTNSDEIIRRYPIKLEAAIDPATSNLIRHALTLVIDRGTGRSLKHSFDTLPLAGKTGTSDDYMDSWFVGFGENRLGTVWVGRDDNLSTGLTGSKGALQVWSKVMRHSDVEPVVSKKAPGVVYRHIDVGAGKAIPENCPNGERLPFHASTIMMNSNKCLNGSERLRRGPRRENSYKPQKDGGLFRWLQNLIN